MPELIRDGHLFLAVPPLYRLTQGAKVMYARDDAHRAELTKKEFNGRGKIEVSRFKGLGEMLPGQLKETTMDPAKRTLLRVEIVGDDGDRRGRRKPDGQQARGALPLHPGARRVRQGSGYLRRCRQCAAPSSVPEPSAPSCIRGLTASLVFR